MTDTPAGIRFVNLDGTNPDIARRVMETMFLPGETVWLDTTLRLRGDTDDIAAQREETLRGPMVIRTSTASGAGAGHFIPTYEFDGVTGAWPSNLFVEFPGTEQAYGILIEHRNEIHFVSIPMGPDGTIDTKAPSTVKLIEPGSTRMTRLLTGIENDAEHLSEMLADGPISGEIVTAPGSPGRHFVYFQVWTSSCAENEIEYARTVIDQSMAPAAQPRP